MDKEQKIIQIKKVLRLLKYAIQDANNTGQFMRVQELKGKKTQLKIHLEYIKTGKRPPALDDQIYVFKTQGARSIRVISE